jgi:hypothetical protein
MFEVIFEERQRFKQLWIWAILISMNMLLLFGIFTQLILHRPFGNKPLSDFEMILLFLFIVFLSILFFYFQLYTKISPQGIYIKFRPFHLKPKFYSWEYISKCSIRKYNPIIEYGGWGYRVGFYKNGGAYNISGNIGLQLEFHDGKKLLIGTQKADELEAYLKQIGKLKE